MVRREDVYGFICLVSGVGSGVVGGLREDSFLAGVTSSALALIGTAVVLKGIDYVVFRREYCSLREDRGRY